MGMCFSSARIALSAFKPYLNIKNRKHRKLTENINTVSIPINAPALINIRCLFSENNVILTGMNPCLLHWIA